MKLTKNTNRVRIESPTFFKTEIYRKLADGTWMDESFPPTSRSQKQMQAFLTHSDQSGYQIYDISEDDIAMISFETNKFGTLTFEGKKYDLQGQADFTNRMLLDWQTEEGYAEFSAAAVDENGNDCTVYWILQSHAIEDLSDLDWNNVDRVRPA